MTNLKDVTFGMNQYCGPAVMSALTGRSTDECAAVISHVSGRKEIKAVNMDELKKAFELLRFDCKSIRPSGYSLFGVLNGLVDSEGMYIVSVPKHVVAVEVLEHKIYLVDNHSKSPLPAEGSARLTQRVDHVYKIIPRPLPKLIREEIIIGEDYRHGLKSIVISSHCVYENPDDNTIDILGTFKYRNRLHLNEIILALQKLLLT